MIAWQEGPPELPGEVETLPLDFWTWVLLLASLVVVLWWLASWWQQFVQQRKVNHMGQQAMAVCARSTSTLVLLQELRIAVGNISSTQRVEAERLSWLLREELERCWGCRCHSATDTELLKAQVVVRGGGPDVDVAMLSPLLAFVTSILYANQCFTIQEWKAKLDDVAVWLAGAAEGRS